MESLTLREIKAIVRAAYPWIKGEDLIDTAACRAHAFVKGAKYAKES